MAFDFRAWIFKIKELNLYSVKYHDFIILPCITPRNQKSSRLTIFSKPLKIRLESYGFATKNWTIFLSLFLI